MAEGIATPKDHSAIEGAIEYPYRVPNLDIRHTHTDPGVPVSWWRSVGFSHNGFAVETFMDELAHEVGQDPYRFRRSLIDHEPRHLGVAGQGCPTCPMGQRRTRRTGPWRCPCSAVLAPMWPRWLRPALSSGKSGCTGCTVLWIAARWSIPDIVRDQIEGGIIFGLTAALYGNITLEGGQVQQSNFHDYPLMRHDQRPEVVVDIIDSDESPTGVGEPGVPPVIPALGNALFALSGKRQRSLPLKASV